MPGQGSGSEQGRFPWNSFGQGTSSDSVIREWASLSWEEECEHTLFPGVVWEMAVSLFPVGETSGRGDPGSVNRLRSKSMDRDFCV